MPNGSLKLKKAGARLVVRGFKDTKSIDETYSPVLHPSVIRLLIALSVEENCHILKFNIKAASVYGHLDEKICIKLPDRFENSNKDSNYKRPYIKLFLTQTSKMESAL